MNQSIPIINHYVVLVISNKFVEKINNIENIANLITKKLKLNVVKRIIYSFKPAGKTLVFILSKSHLIIHNWPENNIIHLDLFTCSDLKEKDLQKALETIFQKNKNCQIIIKKCNLLENKSSILKTSYYD